ncbi:hypothetical protein FC99_GL002473 [Levilactobacillus koreensis JCM 16448]|uniref:Uncharacterized protein n=1 Tax=Levilactobacillus koreensis TaxID=637971 RepID=A0AAC8UVE3_9LACO|nr:hypothetical protein [Levilactobacillus koreensis]AKP64968.1 hypothetical protein ABN16_08095 [Levilactobacillus koreensis]KRK91210.1 hypothetical protein FC99_GL002473 [Levilactobacillus koreensis JCM 16448]
MSNKLKNSLLIIAVAVIAVLGTLLYTNHRQAQQATPSATSTKVETIDDDSDDHDTAANRYAYEIDNLDAQQASTSGQRIRITGRVEREGQGQVKHPATHVRLTVNQKTLTVKLKANNQFTTTVSAPKVKRVWAYAAYQDNGKWHRVSETEDEDVDGVNDVDND